MSGSVRQETNGTYTFQFWCNDPQTGRRKNIKRRGFSSKKAASAEMRRLQVSYETVGPESAGRMSVARYLEIWFEKQCVDKAPATNDRYRNAIGVHISPAIGPLRLVQLGVLHIDQFLVGKLAAGLSPETVHGFYRVLNTALKDAVRWGYLHKNPAENVSPPKNHKAERLVMTHEDQCLVAQVLQAESIRDSRFFRRNGQLTVSTNTMLFNLGLLTGMRRGEMAGLKFSDIDECRNVIHVRRSVSESNGKVFSKSPKTERGLRCIDIDDGLLRLLAEHKAAQSAVRETLGAGWNQDDWLFASAEGAVLAPRALNSRFARLMKRCGLQDRGYGLHTLRHTHISQLLMRNLPPLVVSRRAGHASTATTMNLYGHVISHMAEGVVASHLRDIQRSWT